MKLNQAVMICIFMDYSSVGENGEPTIVRIDNEENNAKYFVAETFRDFYLYGL